MAESSVNLNRVGMRSRFGIPPALKATRLGSMPSGWAFAIAAIGACYLLFFNELEGEWRVNAQYNYGYVVPVLALALFFRRWPEGPVGLAGNSSAAALLGAGMLLLLLPLRIVLEANPEWRLLYWVHGFVVLGLTFCVLYCAGGWSWAGFFAPPLLFVLIAIPWPMNFEQAVIQHLMRLVAGLTVEVLGWLGIPALQQGNLVQVSSGTVGIDEACSGIRSLQSGLMLSLFLGEMHRLAPWRRAGLIGASFVVVLAANLSRTTFLTWAAATRGLPQMEKWHDTAGILVMCLVLPGLMGLAWLLKPRVAEKRVAPAVSPLPGWQIPRWAGIATIGWLATVELTTEAWYRSHEEKLIDNAHWSLGWPQEDAHFRKTSLPENSLAILRCSASESASWQDEDGNLWTGFFLQWKRGKNSEQLAKGHRPDICFPAAGARLVEDVGQVVIDVDGILMRFRHQRFDSGPKVLDVFYCLWADRVSRDESRLLEDGSQASRLLAALAGKRNLGQRVLELVVTGPDSGEAAVKVLEAQLPRLIHR